MGLLARINMYLSLARYSRAHNRDFAREHYSFFRDMLERLRPYIGDLRGRRVLDPGCGKSLWLTLLLHGYGARVTGIDSEFVSGERRLRKYLDIARINGVDRAVRTLGWDLIYAAPYYRELERLCPFPLRFEGIDVRQMGSTELAFPTAEFDVVVSHEVFEHLGDVPGTVRALRRVMKPDAVTYIYVHNYTSLSGGHHVEWKYPDAEPSSTVPPWDHLRANLFPQIPSWINRLREADYRRAFADAFDILEWLPTATEGLALLTPAIRAEMKDYSDAELLTKGFVIVARPRTPIQAPQVAPLIEAP